MKGRTIWRAVQWLAGLTALAALGILLRNGAGRGQSERVFARMRQYRPTATAAVTTPAPSPAETAAPTPPPIDFAALRQTWPDVVAWIQWPLMGLDLPIVQGDTNETYLRALPDGSWSNGGSLFLEANSESVLDWHAIVYGHNMQDGSMFGQLKRWLEEDFYREHRDEAFFLLYTPEGVWRYDLFSIERVQSTDPGVYRLLYQPGETFAAFARAMETRTLYPMEARADGERPVLTLSTCDSAGAARGNRVALHAVQAARPDQG